MKKSFTWCLFFPLTFFLCIANPAIAISEKDSEEVPANFICYQTIGKTATDKNIEIENLYGIEKYLINQPSYLCVPSLKELLNGQLPEVNISNERLVLKMYLASFAENTEGDAIDHADGGKIREIEDNFLFAVPAIIEPEFELLYAVDGADRNSTPHLFTFDPSTGAVLNDFGSIGFEGIDAIAIEPKTENLYGISNGFYRFPMSSDLIHIDTASNTVSLIGGSNPYHCTDLAFDSAGTLYGWSEDGSHNLVTFDLTTGLGTIVGESGIRTVDAGLAFDSSGTLWLKWGRALYTIDRKTGVARFQKNLDQFFGNMLAIDENDVFYTALHNGDIYTFDPTTGKSTYIGATGVKNLSALEFGPEPAPITFLDYYMCYPEVAEKPDATVLIKDRFGETLNTVGDQNHLCAPCIMQIEETIMEGPLIRRYGPEVPYVFEAHQIDSNNSTFQPLDVEVLDQFGKETLRLIAPSFILVFSKKPSDTGH